MTPDPTPVSGIWPPKPFVLTPSTVIRTTAGLTFAAASMIADDSSIVTGCWAPTVVELPLFVGSAWRSNAPVALRARYVPPDAIVAARTDARSTGPMTPPRREARWPAGTGPTGLFQAGAGGPPPGRVFRGGGVGGTLPKGPLAPPLGGVGGGEKAARSLPLGAARRF